MTYDNDVVFQAPTEDLPYLYKQTGRVCAALFVDIWDHCSVSVYIMMQEWWTRGPWWPCNAHLSNIALWEPDLELIKANILIKVQNDYINKKDNVACLMDCEIKVKVKYGWLHSRGHAKMYACTKYHWL